MFFGPIGKTKWPPWPLIGWDIFDFSSETAERNSAKLDRKQALNAFYYFCVFQVNQEKTKWPPWPLICWDIFDFSSKTVKGIWRNLIGRSQRPLPSLCFSGGSEKQNGRPGLWFAETFSTFPLKPLNRIQQNLTGSKISTFSTRLAFFGLIRKTRYPPRPLIGWAIFDFSYDTTELNSTKLDRKQVLNVLFQVCGFRADPKNNMAARASDWLRHIFTFPLKPLNRIQRNLTGSKILTSSMFFGPKSE